jgi:mono/diheme cytochrome c family protein
VECHQAQGEGVANTFPPLAGSEWLQDRDVLLKIMLGGVMGEIEVKGNTYNSVMPGHGHMTDEDLAAIASYVRHSFAGIEGEAVTPGQVEALRPQVNERMFRPFTVEELR